MKNKKHFFKKGFTLVELVVVIAVIAILAAVSVGAYFGVTNSANESKLRTEGKAVFDAVKIAAIEGKGDYTLESTGLTLNDGVNNKQKFNYELNYLTGVNYIIVYETPTLIEGPTLFIYNADEINASYNSSSTYTIINYYSVDVSGKHAIIDVLSGDITIGTNDIEISEDKNRPTVSDPGTSGTPTISPVPPTDNNSNTVLTGNGVPGNELGNDGDSYIDLDTWNFYIKINGNWEISGNIKGEPGIDGQPGATGPQGPEGSQGPQGVPGSDGTSLINGHGVPSDSLGNDGDSYIDLDTWNFYTKTNGVWVISGNIKGEPGSTPNIEIGENGNWFIDGVDTGKPSAGKGIQNIEIVDNQFKITYTDGSIEFIDLPQSEGTQGLNFFPDENGNYVVEGGSTKYLSEVVIPDTYNGKPVVAIGLDGFRGFKTLEKITLGKNVTTIMSGAFLDCYNLTTIDFNNATNIGHVAFAYCVNLKTLTLTSKITSIGYFAFYRCGLSEVTIENSETLRWKDMVSINSFNRCMDDEMKTYFTNAYTNADQYSDMTEDMGREEGKFGCYTYKDRAKKGSLQLANLSDVSVAAKICIGKYYQEMGMNYSQDGDGNHYKSYNIPWLAAVWYRI